MKDYDKKLEFHKKYKNQKAQPMEILDRWLKVDK